MGSFEDRTSVRYDHGNRTVEISVALIPELALLAEKDAASNDEPATGAGPSSPVIAGARYNPLPATVLRITDLRLLDVTRR